MVKLKILVFICFFIISACAMRYDEIKVSEINPCLTLNCNGYYQTKIEYDRFKCCFIYQNSVAIGGGAEVIESKYWNNMNAYMRDIGFKNRYKSIYSCGVINIENQHITLHYWTPPSGGKIPAYTKKGKILNDTTFVFLGRYNKKNGIITQLQDTFHFVKYSPKPDSINPFIKF